MDVDNKNNANPFGVYSISELETNFSGIAQVLEKRKDVILIEDNRPQYALLTIDEYHRLHHENDQLEKTVRNVELPKLLKGVGNRFFVDNYTEIKNDSLMQVKAESGKTNTAASLASRISRGRTIFKKHWEHDALMHIIEAPGTDYLTKQSAQSLLDNELGADINPSIKRFPSPVTTNWHDKAAHLALLDNKAFAYSCLELLSDSEGLFRNELDLLEDAESCKQHFSCSAFPILKRVPNIGDITSEYTHINGRQRYYNRRFILSGQGYIVTNHWYGPGKSMKDNRTPFQNWIIARLER